MNNKFGTMTPKSYGTTFILVAHTWLLQFDMGGAAAVLGAAHTLGFLKPKGLEVSQRPPRS